MFGEYTVRPESAERYDEMCDFRLGMTYCETCGPDTLDCSLPFDHDGLHYARDAHHWEDVYRAPDGSFTNPDEYGEFE